MKRLKKCIAAAFIVQFRDSLMNIFHGTKLSVKSVEKLDPISRLITNCEK